VLKRFVLVAIVVVANLSGQVFVPNAALGATIHLEPNLILINASYNGGQVVVSGEASRDAEVLVRLTGEIQDEMFLKKGRILGILWMNTKMIILHHIPKTYLLYFPSAITESDLSEDPQWQRLGIGFDSLKARAVLTPEEENKDLQFREFLKLKTKEGLYAVHENAITYQDAGEGMRSFRCDLAIPCAIPQGDYTVTAFILKDGKVLKTDDRNLKIKEAGLPALISSLAFNHSVVYGILATLIAIGAGLTTGVFFKKSKGAH
jgi:uncharacterized protein (TIGR02186 family)